MISESKTSSCINLLSSHSKTSNSELLLECMDRYEAFNTRELTEKQLKEFCVEKGLI